MHFDGDRTALVTKCIEFDQTDLDKVIALTQILQDLAAHYLIFFFHQNLILIIGLPAKWNLLREILTYSVTMFYHVQIMLFISFKRLF